MRKILTLVAPILVLGLVGIGLTREVPVGTLKGRLTMQENGKPLAKALVWANGVLGDANVRLRAITDADGNFKISGIPTGEYSLEISGRRHEKELEHIQVAEKENEPLVVQVPPNPYELDLQVKQHMFLPEEAPKILLSGFTKNTPQLKIFKLNPKSVIEAGNITELLYGLPNRDYSQVKYNPADIGKLIKDDSLGSLERDAEGSYAKTLELGQLPEGMYWLKVADDKTSASSYIFVSKIGLVVKSGSKSVEIFCADLKTGAPISGAAITVGALQAKSDANGLLHMDAANLPKERMAVQASYKDSTVLAPFHLFSREAPRSNGDDDNDTKPVDPTVRIVTYTDRTIYRPGDTVQYKGIIRKAAGSSLTPVDQGQQVQISLYDKDENKTGSLSTTVDDHGTFSFAVPTTKDDAPGSYRVEMRTPSQRNGAYYNLANYHKPEFSVKVLPDKKSILTGEDVKAKISAEYFFGGGVPNAKVHLTLARNPSYSFANDDEDSDSDNENYVSRGEGGIVREQDAVLGEDGTLNVSMSTVPDKTEDSEPETDLTDWTYTLSATVSESDEKSFDGQADINVTRTSLKASGDQDVYLVQAGESAHFLMKFAGPDGNLSKPKTLSAKLYRSDWVNKVEKRDFIQDLVPTTDPTGAYHFEVKAPDNLIGDMILAVTATDAAGRQMTEERTLVVWNKAYHWDDHYDISRLSLKLDKKKYTAGETVHALIKSPNDGANVWVTTEADDIITSKLVQVNHGSTIVDIGTAPSDFPNVTVSICGISNKKFQSAERTLRVDDPAKSFNIKIETNPRYEPGDDAHIVVKTTDKAGNPVAAQVSVGIVDEAIYALAEDHFDLQASLYPARYSSVQTEYSFPEIYLDNGDKGPIPNIKVRSKFVDTAKWEPQVWTGPAGQAAVDLKLPDNLTSWRVTARGVTDTTEVGQAKASFFAKKKLMARVIGPNFLAAQDQGQFKLAINNDSGAKQEVNYDLELTNLKGSTNLRGKVEVGDGAAEYVPLTVNPLAAGDAKVVAKVWTESKLSDGVEQKVPVMPSGFQNVQFAAGHTDATAGFSFNLDPQAEAGATDLTVRLQPSLLSGMWESVEGLMAYPYGCTEQTMSRFLPSVQVYNLLKRAGLNKPEQDEKVAKIIKQSMARLKAMRHADGGWGWWEHDDSSEYMTAYVLDGLQQIKEAGVDINSIDTASAVKWAAKHLAETKLEPKKSVVNGDSLYLARVLATYGETKQSTRILLNEDKKEASGADWANIALAYHALPGYESAAQKAYDAMISKAEKSGEGLMWQNGYWFWGMDGTALCLRTMQTMHPGDPRIDETTRLAMAARHGWGWYGTHDTAAMLGVMSKQVDPSEFKPQGTVAVMVNGKQQYSTTFGGKNLSELAGLVHIPAASLQPGSNSIQVVKDGGGIAYYTAQLTQYSPKATSLPGISIERSYRRLVASKATDGTSKLIPDDKPTSEFKVGETFNCELTIKADKGARYLFIYDPMPSNCKSTFDQDNLLEYYGHWWGWDATPMDDHMAIFLDYVPEKGYTVDYTLRAESPGDALVPATAVSKMYTPDERSFASASKLSVR